MEISDSDQMVANIRWFWRFCQSVGYKFRPVLDLKANAWSKTIQTSDGDTIQYAEFYGAKSKPIIDEIDRVLAQHYGFTDTELDYVINYDIKYRMGRDANGAGDDEG